MSKMNNKEVGIWVVALSATATAAAFAPDIRSAWERRSEYASENHQDAECIVRRIANDPKGRMVANYFTSAAGDKLPINVSAVVTPLADNPAILSSNAVSNQTRDRLDTKNVRFAVVPEKNWCRYVRGNHIETAPIVSFK